VIYLVQQQKYYLIVLFLPAFLMLGTVSCGQEEPSFESDIEIKNKSSATSYLETWAPLVEIPPDRDLENLAIQYGFGPNENFLVVKSNDQKIFIWPEPILDGKIFKISIRGNFH
jgi:hypothetical protein